MSDELEKYKKLVDNILDSMEIDKERKKSTPQQSDESVPDKPLKFSSEEEKFAVEKALDEIEQIRLAFLDFQEKVQNLMMFNYMMSPIEQFAEYASNLIELIENNIDESKLAPDSLRKYKRIKQLREQIITNVYNKYKKEKGEDA